VTDARSQVLDDLANGRFEHLGDAVSAARDALAATTPADVLERIAREQSSDPATDDLTVPLAIELSEMTTRAFKAEAALAATPAVGGEALKDLIKRLREHAVDWAHKSGWDKETFITWEAAEFLAALCPTAPDRGSEA
jgi:hypothetical protein